jgi:hypothetical protein
MGAVPSRVVCRASSTDLAPEVAPRVGGTARARLRAARGPCSGRDRSLFRTLESVRHEAWGHSPTVGVSRGFSGYARRRGASTESIRGDQKAVGPPHRTVTVFHSLAIACVPRSCRGRSAYRADDTFHGVRVLPAEWLLGSLRRFASPSPFRSQGFSPSQRFDPRVGLRICFTPHPPLGFQGLQSFSPAAQLIAPRRRDGALLVLGSSRHSNSRSCLHLRASDATVATCSAFDWVSIQL